MSRKIEKNISFSKFHSQGTHEQNLKGQWYKY